ncbi:MAG: DUF302 domain-containing protein [Candidatus Thiodiazotropha sp. 6PLUC2]
MNHFNTRLFVIALLTPLMASPLSAADGSVIKIEVKSSATETVESLKKLITEKRFKIVSLHNHGDEKTVKQVISFEKTDHNARIMWHDPAAILELPLKIAVFQDDVSTQVVYRKPSAFRNSYSLQNCNLLDELDLVMAELAQNASQ